MTAKTFAEEYADMDLRGIVIDMAGRIRNIEAKQDAAPTCPSDQCKDHESRLTKIETTMSVLAVVVLAIVVPVALLILDKVF